MVVTSLPPLLGVTAKMATGEIEDTVPTPESEGKDPAAVALGRKGGKARAEGISKKRRKEIAQKAAKARWKQLQAKPLEDMDFRRSLTELAEYMASEALLTPTSSRSRIARRERRDGLTVTSSPRRFPAPWSVRELEQAFVVLDASEQALTYVYFRKDENEARQACVLTHDEARRIAANIAKLPELIGRPAQQAKQKAARYALRGEAVAALAR